MPTVTTKDGVEIFYKDWGPRDGQVIFFHHGWPLSSDDWDAQMMFFLAKGFRVVAHDRRGHGRSAQVWDGHDMDHYADDVAAVVEHLGISKATHVGHSTGGGEVVRYIARHGEDKVAHAVLISAVPPLMVKTASNPGGTPKEVFDDFQKQVATNRPQFYHDVPAGPFYGYNRPGAKPVDAVIHNWWRQGMMGGAKAHYDGVVAFSQTDFTEDLKAHHRPGAGDPRRRRPGGAVRRFGRAVGQAGAQRHAEDLQGRPAWRAYHACRSGQRRPAGVHPEGLSATRAFTHPIGLLRQAGGTRPERLGVLTGNGGHRLRDDLGYRVRHGQQRHVAGRQLGGAGL